MIPSKHPTFRTFKLTKPFDLSSCEDKWFKYFVLSDNVIDRITGGVVKADGMEFWCILEPKRQKPYNRTLTNTVL